MLFCARWYVNKNPCTTGGITSKMAQFGGGREREKGGGKMDRICGKSTLFLAITVLRHMCIEILPRTHCSCVAKKAYLRVSCAWLALWVLCVGIQYSRYAHTPTLAVVILGAVCCMCKAKGPLTMYDSLTTFKWVVERGLTHRIV